MSNRHSVAGQLMTISCSQDKVTLDLRVHDLGDGVLVCLLQVKKKKEGECSCETGAVNEGYESDNQSVLVSGILRLVLDHQLVTPLVHSLAL